MRNVGLTKAIHMFLENTKIDPVASSTQKRRGHC